MAEYVEVEAGISLSGLRVVLTPAGEIMPEAD